MPSRKHTPAPKKKASGQNIEEWQRHGCKVQYRLTEWEAAELERLARDAGLSPNAYATRVMRRHLGTEPPVRSTMTAMLEERACRADAEYDRMRDE